MIIILKKSATKEQAEALMAIIAEHGLKPLYMPGSERTVLGALGDERVLATLSLEAYPFVDRVLPILSPYKLASRELQTHDTVVMVGSVPIGPGHFTVIAGPCAVESEAQILESARLVKAAGARILRGGAYKPRTSPYSFQGLEEEGLKLLAAAREETGLPVVTEIIDVHDSRRWSPATPTCSRSARATCRTSACSRSWASAGKPVLLKRGMSATVRRPPAERRVHPRARATPRSMLCERGIRTFETDTRNTLDLNAVPYLQGARRTCPSSSTPATARACATWCCPWPRPPRPPAPTA